MSKTNKYPIGTKIRFINTWFDTNKDGIVVAIRSNGEPTIYLPTALKHVVDNYHPILSDGTKYTWHCRWNEIELLTIPNQQLVFSFMSNG